MKYLVLFLFVFLGCKDTTKKEIPVEEKLEIPKMAKKDTDEVSNKSFNSVFLAKAEGTNDDFSQKLRINWVSENEIEYDLIYDNQLCEGECSGNATLKDSEINSEINNYTEGDYKFSFIQFEDQKDDFKILIKIQATKKNEAKVEFVFEENEGDCSPYSTMMLAIKNIY